MYIYHVTSRGARMLNKLYIDSYTGSVHLLFSNSLKLGLQVNYCMTFMAYVCVYDVYNIVGCTFVAFIL